jgi:SAM-dependent methyltransferase
MTNRTCKICTQETTAIHDPQFAADYYYCCNCSFIFKDETHILPPEKAKERYLLHINTPQDKGYVEMLKTFIRRSVLPFQSGGRTALDYGSGPGPVLADLLEEMGYSVDIYDIYFAPRENCLEKSYHLVTCTEVVEHLEDPMDTFKLLKRLLAPGGILALMTLFHPGPKAFTNWWYRRDKTHISFFRPETFRYIAKELDMEILMIDEKNTISMVRA